MCKYCRHDAPKWLVDLFLALPWHHEKDSSKGQGDNSSLSRNEMVSSKYPRDRDDDINADKMSKRARALLDT